MDVFIDFLLNNYLWFLIISLILIFALIGYLVDINTDNKGKKKAVKPIKELIEDTKLETHPSVEIYTNEEFDDPLIR